MRGMRVFLLMLELVIYFADLVGCELGALKRVNTGTSEMLLCNMGPKETINNLKGALCSFGGEIPSLFMHENQLFSLLIKMSSPTLRIAPSSSYS